MSGSDSTEMTRELGRIFVGREKELEQIREGFDTLSDQRGRALILTGSSGIGKTELITESLRQIENHPDTLVLSARCLPAGGGPYQSVEPWIDGLCAYLKTLSRNQLDALMPPMTSAIASLFPALEEYTPANRREASAATSHRKEYRWQAFHAFRDLLTDIADQRRLVLVLDELQWADDDSLDLIRSLLRYAKQPAMLFLGSCRNDDCEEIASLKTLADSIENLDQILVEPLTQQESFDLALSLLDQQGISENTIGVAQSVSEKSKGNPFLLRELVRQQTINQLAQDDDATLSIEGVMWRRIQQLSEGEKNLLYLLCVAGRPLPHEFLVALADDRSDSAASLQALFDQYLVCDSGEGLVDAAHDRIRDAVLSHLDVTSQSQMHQQLAELGESRLGESRLGKQPAFLATQYREANLPEKTADFCVVAGETAMTRYAFHQAAHFYAEAISLNRLTEPRRLELQRAMADCLASAGRSTEAAREYLSLADSLSGSASLDARRQAFTQFLQMGLIHEGVAVLKVVLDELGMSIPRTIRKSMMRIRQARFQLRMRGTKFRLVDEDQIPPADLRRIDILWSVTVCMRRIDLIRGVAFGAQTCVEAIRVGERHRIARAIALEAMHQSIPGVRASQRAEELIEQAKQLIAESDDTLTRTQVTMCDGIKSACLGQWKRCLTQAELAEEGYRSNEVGEITTSRFWQMYSLVWLGRFAELQYRCITLVENAEERGDLYEIVSLGTFPLAMARLAQDRPTDAWNQVSATMEHWTQEEFQVQHHLEVVAKVSIRLYEGNHQGAAEILQEHWSRHKRSLMWAAHLVRANMLDLSVRIALRGIADGSDTASAIRDAKKGIEALRNENLPWTTALATFGEASIERFAGNRDAAEAKYREVAEQFQKLDMELHAAVARWRLGQLLGDESGRPLMEESEVFMRRQQIHDPIKMADFVMPG